MPMRFEFRPEKFVQAIAYLAQTCPGITKMKACKMLFFADKEHLRRFGRPIIGDQYYRLPHGPAPTRGLDMLRGRGAPADQALLEKYVAIVNDIIHLRRAADRQVFSKSDLEILAGTCREYGTMTSARLRALSHKEPAWLQADENGPMDYALFFGEDCGDQNMRELAEEAQESRDALRPFRA